MADNFLFAQLQPYFLYGAGAITGATTITLKSMLDIDGNALSMSGTFGSIGFGTIEPGSGTQEEQICFTGLTNNSNGTVTLTGVKSVSFTAPYTQTTGLLKTHAGSTTFVISNTSGFYDKMTAKDDDETILGTWTFTQPNYPKMDGTTPFPTNDAQLATKAYADSLTFAGAPDASLTQKGIVEIATQAEVDAKTVYGGTSAYLMQSLDTQRSTLLSDYIVATGSPNVIVLTPSPAVSAYTAGQTFSFKLNSANTSPTVSINVNGLGAKNVVKLNGNTSPVAGDMASGQVITVEYDGTNFQMLTPVANAPMLLSTTKFGGTGADGALTVTSGSSTISLNSSAVVVKNYSSITISSTAFVNFTSPATAGTVVIWKCTGDVIITSSSAMAIDLRSLGATGGAGGAAAGTGGDASGAGGAGMGGNGNPGTNAASPSANNVGVTGTSSAWLFKITGGTGGQPTAAATIGGIPEWHGVASSLQYYKVPVIPGSGGGGGGGTQTAATSGAGGRGGGALYIECAGALNFTGTINASGAAGGNSTGNGTGGGGGGGGSVVILYNTLTANSGTLTVGGGAGGTGNSDNGGTGGAGLGLVALNTDFV